MSEGRTCADVTLLMGPGIALKDVEKALRKHFRTVAPVFPVSTSGRVLFEMGGYNEEPKANELYIEKDVTNAKRAEWADKAVKAFQAEVSTDDEDVLGDLLCNLMHWADKKNYDWDLAMDRARGHYDGEVKDEKEVQNQSSVRHSHGVGGGSKKQKRGTKKAR